MKSCLAIGWLFALLVLLLTACGGTQQTGGTNIPNVLHVVRTDTLPGHRFVALDMVIHDATQVQDLYKAAYTLKIVQGEMSCPADVGLEYHLDFLRGSTSVQQMDLDATGCQFLHISAQDARFTSPSFQASLTKMLNLSSLVPPCAFGKPVPICTDL